MRLCRNGPTFDSKCTRSTAGQAIRPQFGSDLRETSAAPTHTAATPSGRFGALSGRWCLQSSAAATDCSVPDGLLVCLFPHFASLHAGYQRPALLDLAALHHARPVREGLRVAVGVLRI